MSKILAIALGGAIGALGRHYISTLVYMIFGRGFPYGTLTVNVLGSFLIGLVVVWITERHGAEDWRLAFFMIGLLGAFTTFSTFSLETLSLLEHNNFLAACLNMIISVVVCLSVTWLGLKLGRAIWAP